MIKNFLQILGLNLSAFYGIIDVYGESIVGNRNT